MENIGQSKAMNSNDIQIKTRIFNRHWTNSLAQIKNKLHKQWPTQIGSKKSWYIVIGEKNQGTTNLLHACDALTLLENDLHDNDGVEFEPLRFWLMQNNIVLETPGDFIEQSNETDTALWWNLLKQIKRIRTNTELNGIILCVSAETLKTSNMTQLHNKGSNIRQRLDELMNVFNVCCPVYVMITKCNVLGDLETYFSGLPLATTKQVMGKLQQIDQDPIPIKAVVKNTIHYVYEQLNILRLINLQKNGYLAKVNNYLFFPERLKLLTNRLSTLLQPVFDMDRALNVKYYAALRGVFFSDVEKITKLQQEIPKNSKPENNNNAAYFVQELFTVVLPGDKNRVSSSESSAFFSFRVRLCFIALCFTLFVGILTFGLLNFKFAVEHIEKLNVELSMDVNTESQFEFDLFSLDKIRKSILALELQNENKRGLGRKMSQTDILSDALKREFTRRFFTKIYVPAQNYLGRSIDLIEDRSFPKLVRIHKSYLLLNRALITHAIYGDKLHELMQLSQPDYSLVFENRYLLNKEKYLNLFKQNFLAFLVWNNNISRLESELAKINIFLARIGDTN